MALALQLILAWSMFWVAVAMEAAAVVSRFWSCGVQAPQAPLSPLLPWPPLLQSLVVLVVLVGLVPAVDDCCQAALVLAALALVLHQRRRRQP
jgi:hypothetical protein